MRNRWKALALASAMMLSMSGCGIVKEESATPTDASTASETDASKVSYTEKDGKVTYNIRPQDDFYGYVNANDLWNMEIEYGESSAGTFDICNQQVIDEQIAIVQEILSSDEEFEPGSPEQLIRDFYFQQKEKKQDYTKEFDEVFALIDGMKTPDDVATVSAELYKNYGVNSLFTMQLDRNPYTTDEYAISLPNLQTTANLKKLLEENREQLETRDMLRDYLTGFGVETDEAKERADAIVYFLIDVAAVTDTEAVEEQDVEKLTHIYSEKDLDELLSNIDLGKLLDALEIKNNPYDGYNVYLPEQMEVINSYITEDNVDMWKDYFKCYFVRVYEEYAPASYLYYTPEESVLPDEMILETVVVSMSNELGELYYNTYYTDEYKDYMAKMEKDIRKAYVDMINGADWLSKEGRASMVKKFNNINFHFGGQEVYEHKASDAKLIGKNAYETQKNFARRQFDNTKANVGAKPDDSVWGMTSPTINAYYSPSANDIYITRGIMNAPFCDLNRDYASNLGGLGSVIGHELSHAFDSNGMKYDADGVYNPDWISKEDQAAFEEKQKQVIDFYNKQTLLDVYHIDGEKTLGENLADIGAVECMLAIVNTKEEKEKLFEAYAVTWCALYPDKGIIAAVTNDVHSPDLIRVNAVLSNFEDFYDVYDVQEGDGMYLEPENRVVRW